MDGMLHGSKVKDILYVPGESDTSVDDNQLGTYHRTIVDNRPRGPQVAAPND